MMDPASVFACPKQIINAPSAPSETICHNNLPLIPILTFMISLINPPSPRAKIFNQPKIEAKAAADS